MIDMSNAKTFFNYYVSKYDTSDAQIALKIKHTYRVINASEMIAAGIGLKEEDIELAKLIGLLHDIGRFEQVKRYNTFVDSKSIDHARFGVSLLFDDGLIRKFIDDKKYDHIIKKAILNHNKYQIMDTLSDIELLHAKIIRDADKIDNFYLKTMESFSVLFHCNEIHDEILSDHIYETFLDQKCILATDRITNMDCWVSYLAWIYDLNFDSSIKIVKDKDYINQLIDRIDYKNTDTKNRMGIIKDKARQFLNNESLL